MTRPRREEPPDAWYRSPAWDEHARNQFEQRLARARPYNRDQYRRIKACALLETGDERKQAAAVKLLRVNLEHEAQWDFEKVMTLNVLSPHEQDVGRLDDAERHLRELLRLAGPDGSGTSCEEEIRLAEILLERGGAEHLHEAKALLAWAIAPRSTRSRAGCPITHIHTATHAP